MSSFRFRLKPAAAVLLGAVSILALSFGLHWYRYRFVRSDADLPGLLPKTDATTFFVDIEAVRQAGLLGLFAQTQRTDDPEYAQFVQQAGFSYQRDLRSLTGSVDGKQQLFALRGHFDWLRLSQYAKQHGGSCQQKICSAPTSKPGRWASFTSIQPDVLALAVSEDRTAVRAIAAPRSKSNLALPTDPVWVNVSRSLLKNPLSLPLAIRIFAISLQSADSVILAVGSANQATDAFSLRLRAQFPNDATAETTRNQLEIQTKMLKLELGREHKPPNPNDLSGLMTAGTFQVVNNGVVGIWPVRKELLKSLE